MRGSSVCALKKFVKECQFVHAPFSVPAIALSCVKLHLCIQNIIMMQNEYPTAIKVPMAQFL